MNSRVWVGGAGVITAIGDDAPENLNALLNSRSGISELTFLETVHQKELPCGEIKRSTADLALRAGCDPSWPRTAVLSLIAAKEAFDSTALSDDLITSCAFISANTVGGMDRSENYMRDYFSENGQPALEDIRYHDGGAVTGLVANHLGIRKNIRTISTACSSSANAIAFGARMIRAGKADLVLAGGADALCRFTLNGFNTLLILDKEPCKPYDEHRKGLNLGEGAGYILLVSDKYKTHVREILGEVTGFGYANDAHHATALSPEGTGPRLAMQRAMTEANLNPSDIGFINLHGTGTPNNDIAEGRAILDLFGDQRPPVSSTKTFTGHTLGACGGVEAVYSLWSVRFGHIFPSLRFATPMKEFDLAPATKISTDPTLRHVMSNSFGFGGNCTSLIFSKAE